MEADHEFLAHIFMISAICSKNQADLLMIQSKPNYFEVPLFFLNVVIVNVVFVPLLVVADSIIFSFSQ